MSFWIPNCEMHMSNVSYRRWLTCLIGFPTTTEKGRSRQSGLVGIQLSWLRASQPFHPPLRKKVKPDLCMAADAWRKILTEGCIETWQQILYLFSTAL